MRSCKQVPSVAGRFLARMQGYNEHKKHEGHEEMNCRKFGCDTKVFSMKMIPLLRCDNLKESISFYTNVLDFRLKYPGDMDNEWAIDLINGDAELILARWDGTPRIAVYIRVSDVDALFLKYIDRGLIVPNNPDSPVHNSPIDQTWGMREFYVNDPSGNTLRFAQRVE